jgi:DNA-binding LacI/PurR family transcriptional regulator
MTSTLASLAKEAGVDPSLVSRVLRGDPSARISDEKRARILELARITGYRANRLAKSLRTQKTMILGMLSPDITNPFHSWLFRAVEEQANAAGYDVILSNTDDDPERSRKLIQTLSEGHIDGLLVATARKGDNSIDLLREIGMPYVLLNRHRDRDDEPWFGPDAFQAGWNGGEHLIRLGHQRIGFLQGDLAVGQMADRLSGFRAVMKKFDLPVDETLVVTGLKSRGEANAAAHHLLQLPGRRRPTAIFVPNTVLTDGVAQAIYTAGVRVPDEISILGYSAGFSPAVTSLCVPTAEIGRRATEHLIQFLASGARAPVSGGAVHLNVQMVDRGTTASPV